MNLKQKTINAFLWSVFQNWGNKVFTLLVFVVLARYLTPSELGLASAVTLVLAFVAVLSEQGFPEAIIQRQHLEEHDLNLPFVVSCGVSLIASMLLFFRADFIASIVNATPSVQLIKLSAVIPPLSVFISFESAVRKKNLDFKSLAKVTLLSNLISGFLTLGMVSYGFGASALIFQVMCYSVLTTFFLWRNRIWFPRLVLETSKFKYILSYSVFSFGSKLLDFFSLRIIDLIVLTKYGSVGLGIYTVGSKVYLTALQLLSSVLSDVALSSLSKISYDKVKLKETYLKLISLSSSTAFPMLILLATLSSSLTSLFFGQSWKGVDDVMFYLCLLGAFQVVQYFNGPIINSVGESRLILILNISKLLCASAFMLFWRTNTVLDLVKIFVISQLFYSPLSFYFAIKISGANSLALLKKMYPGMLSALISMGIVNAMNLFFLFTPVEALFVNVSVYTLLMLIFLSALSSKNDIEELKSLLFTIFRKIR